MSTAGVSWDPLGFQQLRGSIDDDGVEPSLIEEIDTAIHDLGVKVIDDRYDGEAGGTITIKVKVKRFKDTVMIDGGLEVKDPPKPRRAVVAVKDIVSGNLLTQGTRQRAIWDRKEEETQE